MTATASSTSATRIDGTAAFLHLRTSFRGFFITVLEVKKSVILQRATTFRRGKRVNFALN
jgi:hypothetical protein